MAESSRRTSEMGGPPATTMPSDVEKTAQAPPEILDEAEHNFQPKTFKFWSVMLSIYLALFLVALDRTIIGTAIPQITQDFHSLGDIGWYGSAYQLTTAASQLVFGRIYKFYEVKRVFLIAVALFEIGSVICGAAPNSIAFILGRAIAGLGGAGIFSGVMIIMIPLVPLRKRPMFQGIFGMVFGVSSVMGPLVGGAFTDRVTWRWCFYINLPVGAVTFLCLLIVNLPNKPPVPASFWEHFTRLDPLGTLFFIPSIVCLLLALQWGGSTYAWHNWRIILLFVLFGVLFIVFASIQVLMPNTATVPVRIISQRSITAATVFMFALTGAMLMTVYYLPLWFQVVQGVSAVQSGIDTLPLVLSLVAASFVSGGLTHKLGYYVPCMIICPTIMSIGLGLLTTFDVGESSAHWIGYQFLVGFGLGMGMQSAGLAAQAVLPKPDIPTGISIIFFVQQLGGAIFTSVGQNLLSSYMVQHVSEVPGLSPEQITNDGATGLVESVPPSSRPAVRKLYNDALTKVFLCAMGVSLVAFVAAFFMEWKNIKKTGPKANLSGEMKEDSTTTTGEQETTIMENAENLERRSAQLEKEERISNELTKDTSSSTSKVIEQSTARTSN
ncbi:MFS general substrate transporter [Annulohypoxylon maeteangense]|uniref:MFS general substrate transporter n=1 Tax=Annulohypoxylon maeteangense TaxID=1927788 RepID=UPI002008B641|nr:MFS general substrate transporter [Annulohypoxylon maeteangense]KAI0890175.1 MFS general substrate transporter [Annulohypoxylon maeteangense]